MFELQKPGVALGNICAVCGIYGWGRFSQFKKLPRIVGRTLPDGDEGFEIGLI
jgi:hypothetical protein